MKKIVTFMGVLTLSICALTAISNTHATDTEAASNLRYVGDVNEDGTVDAKDASIVLTTYSSLSTGVDSKLMQELADVNHDGYINAKDASEILKLYSVASTGELVEYEFVFVDNSTTTTSTTIEAQTTTLATTTTSAASKISEGSVMELVSGSWYIHSEITDNLDDKLYENKAFLVAGEKFVIIEIKEDYWYASILDGDDNTPVYLRIPEEYMSSNFKKVGQMAATSTTTALATTETTSSATTTTNTEATSSTTASTTTETTSSTTIATTTTASETVSQTTTSYKEWTVMRYTGTETYPVRFTPVIPEENLEDNIVDRLRENQIFFIKSHAIEDWYKITVSNGLDEHQFVKIDEKNFVVDSTVPYQFIGISWNLRSDKSTESEILDSIEYGDIVAVIEMDEDGWAKVKTNKLNNGVGEAYVLTDKYNFIKL